MEESGQGSMHRHNKAFGVVLFLLISLSCYSQKQIHGIVIDSGTFSPLSNVNIKIKHSFIGTATNAKGEFRLNVMPRDTIQLSLVGYYTEDFAVSELETTAIIRMTEEIRMLQTITVVPKGDQQKPVRPLHLAPQGKLMNYGLTGAGINLGYFSKLEKEKRKLALVQAENRRTKSYVAVVCSPEVRERITEQYGISDDDYYGILAQFNLESGNSLYNLTSEELIVVLENYFRRNVRKR
jgi:hypothetical protein